MEGVNKKQQQKAGQNYERRLVADQIKKARNSEQETERLLKKETRYHIFGYEVKRGGKEYVYRMGGLKHLFNYVRGLSSNKVLDVGTGFGNGIYKISQMDMAQGLDFHATALRNIPESETSLAKDKIHITGVETLRGIKNESFAGVLGLHSVAYSTHPDMAIKRIDEVLIPGGVFKATFASFGHEKNFDGSVFQDPQEFLASLRALDYDMAVVADFRFHVRSNSRIFVGPIVLAIKPGNPSTPSAQELLDLDIESVKAGAVDEYEGLPVFDIED